MRQIKSTVTYVVPNWNFCNSDNVIHGGEITKNTCRFCIKSKTGHHCVLYDRSLSVNDGLIYKVRACCEATAGFASAIDLPPPTPTINPKELMRHTIDLYTKTVNDLVNQGYPRSLADIAAKNGILSE